MLLLYAFWWNSPLLSQFDYKLYDGLGNLTSEHIPEHSVVVEIDDESLKAFGQWPWSRLITAELIRNIEAAEPSTISLDILFSEEERASPQTLRRFYHDIYGLDITIDGLPSRLQNNDLVLAQTISESNVVLPVFMDRSGIDQGCLLPAHHLRSDQIDLTKLPSISALVCSMPMYQRASHAIGHIHAGADSDGILRRIPMFIRYHEETIPALALSTLSLNATKANQEPFKPMMNDLSIRFGDRFLSLGKDTEVLLKFYPNEAYHRLSAYDVLKGSFDPKLVRGKHVFVGTSALGLDTWHTLSDGRVIPGVYVHATAAENLLNGDLIVQPSVYKSFNFILSLIVALLLLMFMQKMKTLVLLFTAFGIVFLSAIATYWGWLHHLYISIGYLLFPLLSFLFFLSLVMFVIEYQRTKQFLETIRRSQEQKQLLQQNLQRSESEIEHQKVMLFQQSKLAAMGEMIDNIAHQWRQPLNLLGMIVQDLEYAHHSGKMDRRYLEKSSKDSMDQIEFMSQTIEDFRNFVKPDQKPYPFDINLSVAETLQLLEAMFVAKRIKIEVEYSLHDLIIFGSSGEFKQVLINLLNNARDALVENQTADPKIRICIFQEKNNGVVTIHDNGGGIPTEVIDRIFEPYFTTKEEGKGSGVGLYIVYSIIRTKMGGVIEAENKENGTQFLIKLPLAEESLNE